MRSTFVRCLIDRARIDPRIILVTPDMGFSVFEPFMAEFPDRFFNVGICEQNAVSVAAGLALRGKIVYVYSIIPFVTMRCFEQVRVDVAYMATQVRLVGVGAGLTYGPAGATHHAIEDISIMRSLPNMTVCCPGDPVETEAIFKQSFDHEGPMYIRLGKNGEPRLHTDGAPIVIGKAAPLRQGQAIALFATSTMLATACRWVDFWSTQGHNVALISFHTIKPLDVMTVRRFIDDGFALITLEEHSLIGGLGTAVAEVIADYGKPVSFKRLGLPDDYCHLVGNQAYLLEHYGLYHLSLEDLLS